MTVPPPPPDLSAPLEMSAPPLPARGYAIGVSLLGVAAVGFGFYFGRIQLRLEDTLTLAPALLLACALAAFSGALGGWLCWRRLMRGLPLSLPRALGIAAATTVASLVIGSLAGGLLTIILGLAGALGVSTVEAGASLAVFILSTLIFGPIFAVVLFGPPFGVLVLAWTLLWRYRVNRQASAASPS